MAIKQIVALSPYQDPTGNVLAGGTLTLDLSQPAVATGSGEVAPLRITVALNSSGTFSATNLWANDQLTPSGTTYRLRAYNNNGLLAGDWGAMSIQGTSPIDISALIPLVTVPSVSLGAVLLNPGGLQTITGFPLAAPAFQSSSANPAQSGVIRLANVDGIVWRNGANSGDLSLGVNSTNTLLASSFNGILVNTIFGGSTGVAELISHGANPALSGVLRLATGDSIGWRNNANSGDVALAKNTNDSLTFSAFVMPQVVAVVNLTGQTAAIGQTTFYTTPASGAGIYRASLSLILTTQGTGGVIFENISWNNGTAGNVMSTGNLSTTTTLGAEINAFTSGATNFYCAAGTAVTHQVTFSGVTGSPAYSVRIRLEYVG